MPTALFGLRSLVGGGVETTALTLHSYLQQSDSDWRIWLALMEDYGELRQRASALRGILRPRGGPRTAAQREDILFALMALPRVVGYGCRLQRLLDRIAPEVLFTHSGVEFLAAARWLRTGPQKTVWAAGVGSDVLRDMLAKHPRQEKLIRAVLAQLYGGPQYLVTASHGLAKVLIEELKVPPQRVEVIGNPVELAALSSPIAESEPLPAQFILGVGRFAPVKGFDLLVRAVADVSKTTAPLPLILLGEGPERSALERLARDLDYQHLSMPGFVTDPARYMKAATAVVIPSRLEGFSNVTVEAMACGAPLIVTDCPHGPREIIAEGCYGILVAKDDVRALAEAIAKMLLQPELRAHYAAAAKVRAADFDAPKIARDYLKFFERISGR